MNFGCYLTSDDMRFCILFVKVKGQTQERFRSVARCYCDIRLE